MNHLSLKPSHHREMTRKAYQCFANQRLSESTTTRNSLPPPSFSGLSHHIKQKDRWFSTETMYRLLGIPYCKRDRSGKVSEPIQTKPAYSTTYLGKLPSVMALEKNLPTQERCTPHQWLQRIEDFAAYLRPYNRTFTKEVLSEDLSSTPPNSQWSPMTARFVDRANYGTVYRIQYKGKDFALKVFHVPTDTILNTYGKSLNGPVAEATANLNLSRYGESQIPLIDLANPTAGWILREFIDPEKSYAHRTGSNRKPLPFVSSDASASEQYVSNMLVDLGGAEPVYRFQTVDAFLEKLKDPFALEKTIRSFSLLSAPMREEALIRAGQEGLTSPQLLTCFDYYTVYPDVRQRIAKAWANHPNNWPLLCERSYVIAPEEQMSFIQQAIKRPDCHKALMRTIYWGLTPEAQSLLQRFRIQMKEKQQSESETIQPN
jgi:hypothetical protein